MPGPAARPFGRLQHRLGAADPPVLATTGARRNPSNGLAVWLLLIGVATTACADLPARAPAGPPPLPGAVARELTLSGPAGPLAATAEARTLAAVKAEGRADLLQHQLDVLAAQEQIGSPRDIYERPRNKFVADFVGTTNFLEATITAVEATPGRYMVESPIGKLAASSAEVLGVGDKVVLSLRPEDVELADRAFEGTNTFEAVVDAKVFLGEHVEFQVKMGDRILLAKAHPSLRTVPGEKIYFRINADKCVAIPDSSAA